MVRLGDRLRATRRKTNGDNLRLLQETIVQAIADGEDVVGIPSTLHREMVARMPKSQAINHPAHPDYDLWRAFDDWALQQGMVIQFEQSPSEDYGWCCVRVGGRPENPRIPAATLVVLTA